jgi:GNAT superfamily N-acetyltransferase
MTVREMLPPETGLAHRALQALRPDCGGPQEFVNRTDGELRVNGFRLVGSFEAGADEAVAVAGFRIGQSLAWGRHLYVDDLVTLPQHRRRGHARRLLDWLTAEGERQGCTQLHLDSGVGVDRAPAHALYLGAGLVISAHHFARRLRPRSLPEGQPTAAGAGRVTRLLAGPGLENLLRIDLGLQGRWTQTATTIWTPADGFAGLPAHSRPDPRHPPAVELVFPDHWVGVRCAVPGPDGPRVDDQLIRGLIELVERR